MADEEFISTAEAAEQLGITRQRVLQLIEDGRLDAKKFANIYMIRRASLSNVEGRKPGRPPKAIAEVSEAIKKGVDKKKKKSSAKR